MIKTTLNTGITTYVPSNGGRILVTDHKDYCCKYPNTYKSFKDLRNGKANL